MNDPQKYNFAEGEVLLINKPLNWTSFDVVKKIRNLVRAKVGHAGTLDPMATGLLILCTGKFTKRLPKYMGMEKEYWGKIYLGATTASYDSESPPENIKDISHIREGDIREVLGELIGEIEQVPPIYSALKVKGQPMYKLAREGQVVKPQPRKVEIRELSLKNVALPEVEIKVVCSKGTYIRSLAHDIGQSLGTGAYLSALKRTRIGDFTLQDTWELEDFVNLMESQKQGS